MTTYSMTGFGEGRAEAEGVEVSVETKSLNNRFVDVICRLPSSYSKYEVEITKIVRQRVRRGRVELFVSRREERDDKYSLAFNEELFGSNLKIVRDALKIAGVDATPEVLSSSVLQILGRKEVIELSRSETEATEKKDELGLVTSAVNNALNNLVAMREKEGLALEKELGQQIAQFESALARVKENSVDVSEEFRERLSKKIERLVPDVELEEARLVQEVAYLAEKVDITEELVRLDSHIVQFKKIVEAGEGGRKLEFLLQEFGREINTIGSKSQKPEISAAVIEAKGIAEKLREQVANIE